MAKAKKTTTVKKPIMAKKPVNTKASKKPVKKPAAKKPVKKSKKNQPGKIRRHLNFGNFSILVGLVLVILGASLLLNPFLSWLDQRSLAVQTTQEVISQSQPAQEIPRIEGKPASITVDSVKINLPVVDGIYYPRSATWSLSLDKAHYGTITTLPNNQSGNTFIYAHNRKNVFMSLPKVQVGDLAVVTATDGKKFIYKYRTAITTTPEDTTILNYQGAPILTLQTCTGAWYQNRTLFIFDFVSVEEPTNA